VELLSPGHLIVVLIVLGVLFFGWKQLPDMARSAGRSLRVFRTEVTGAAETPAGAPAPASSTVPAASPAPVSVTVPANPTVAVVPVTQSRTDSVAL
jgi:sec-independent protein translocase protein TatA